MDIRRDLEDIEYQHPNIKDNNITEAAKAKNYRMNRHGKIQLLRTKSPLTSERIEQKAKALTSAKQRKGGANMYPYLKQVQSRESQK